MSRILTFVIFAFLFITKGYSQDISVTGGFIEDSTRVGDEVIYYLSTRTPADVQIIYPDSSFNYAPFEFRKKRFFISQTKNGVSVDSAVYHLSTFEVDPAQVLRLPVYKVNPLDCTKVFSSTDTIHLRLMVKKLPEQISSDLPVRATIAYQKVSGRPNVPVWIMGIALMLVLSVLLWFTFSERIHRYFRIRQLKKRHREFLTAFNSKLNHLQANFSREEADQAVALWKRYMESINRIPYTRLTTQEIRRAGKDSPIVNSLHQLDSVIYGYGEKAGDALNDLRKYSDEKLEAILTEIKNE